jgi:hypothetical protein
MKILTTLISCILLFIAGCFGPAETETDVEEYAKKLEEWKPTGLVNHFPGTLPTSAMEIKFSSFPGFLQGGAWIQIRIVLPDEEIRRIYEDATTRAKQYHDGGSAYTLVNERDNGLRSASFRTSENGVYEFPKDYRVFIFEAKPYKTGVELSWNHGESMGIVVNLQRNEVIYYAEDW